MAFETNTSVFIIESNRIIREAVVTGRRGDFYTIRFKDGGAIRLRESRLYRSKEEAEAIIRKSEIKEKTKKYQSPYDYWY